MKSLTEALDPLPAYCVGVLATAHVRLQSEQGQQSFCRRRAEMARDRMLQEHGISISVADVEFIYGKDSFVFEGESCE